MIPAIANTGLEFLVYLLVAILIASLYLAIRKIRMSQLLSKNQLTGAKRFGFGAETSLAVSDEGVICVINFKLKTLTIDIKEIAEFEILLSKYCITNAKASKNEGLLFKGISDRLKPVLAEDKFKEITFIIRLKNNKIFIIYLLKGSRAKKLIETKQNNIVLLFETLEAAERKHKGK